jgi:hypothetical protein
MESYDKLRSVFVELQPVRSLCVCPDVKMERTMGQRVDVNSCVKLQKSASETIKRC